MKKERLDAVQPFRSWSVLQVGSQSPAIQLGECFVKHICRTIHIFFAKNQRRRKNDFVAGSVYQNASAFAVLMN